MRMIIKILESILSWLVFLTEKLPVILLLFIGVFYSINIFANTISDTTAITNTAFAIAATITALSFAYSRSLEEGKPRDRILFSGERLYHSSILILIASLLKYVSLIIGQLESVKSNDAINTFLLTPIGVLAAISFFYAVLNAHTAIRIINDELWKQHRRHKDWDDVY